MDRERERKECKLIGLLKTICFVCVVCVVLRWKTYAVIFVTFSSGFFFFLYLRRLANVDPPSDIDQNLNVKIAIYSKKRAVQKKIYFFDEEKN